MFVRTAFAAALLSLVVVCLNSAVAGEKQEASASHTTRIGAVAYSPSVVTIFNDIKRYLDSNEFPCDYVLYSNYDALVEALDRGEVDIAWNTPLAHAQYHVKNACASQTLVMRDVDKSIRSVLVVRTDSGIDSLDDLVGKTLVLGSWDAAEATVLPVHYLKENHVDLDKLSLLNLDQERDMKGNPCSSPKFVLAALQAGRGQAGIITEGLWNKVKENPKSAETLKVVWQSPEFSHCVFTAGQDFDSTTGRRFTELMTNMKSDDPLTKEAMRLEGTRQWIPGDSAGFNDLVDAIRESD